MGRPRIEFNEGIDDEVIRSMYVKDKRGLMGLSKEFGVTAATARKRLERLGIAVRSHSEQVRKYSMNRAFFSKPNLLNSYWAGFIAADFHLTKTSKNSGRLDCCLSAVDSNQLNRFFRDIEYTGNINFGVSHGFDVETSNARIFVCCGEYINDLWKNFRIPHGQKWDSLEPPPGLTRELELAYIAGYIDGDGWVSFAKDRLVIGACGDLGIISWIKNVMDDELAVMGEPATTDLTPNHSIWTWRTMSQAWHLGYLLYHLPVDKLERKLPQLPKYEAIAREKLKRREVTTIAGERLLYGTRFSDAELLMWLDQVIAMLGKVPTIPEMITLDPKRERAIRRSGGIAPFLNAFKQQGRYTQERKEFFCRNNNSFFFQG